MSIESQIQLIRFKEKVTFRQGSMMYWDLNLRSRRDDNGFLDMYRMRDSTASGSYLDRHGDIATTNRSLCFRDKDIDLFRYHDIHINQNVRLEIIDDVNLSWRCSDDRIFARKVKRSDYIFRCLMPIGSQTSYCNRTRHVLDRQDKMGLPESSTIHQSYGTSRIQAPALSFLVKKQLDSSHSIVIVAESVFDTDFRTEVSRGLDDLLVLSRS